MSNIINQIIGIDSVAQAKLDEANAIKESMKEEIAAKIQQTNAVIEEKTNTRIAQIEEIELQYAQEEMSKIKGQTSQALHQLEETYNHKHLQLEDAIFNRVVAE